MVPPAVFMFSGLGSQTHQMGRELFRQSEIFRAAMLRLDQLAQPLVGYSILGCMYSEARKNGEPMHAIVDSCLAIYLVELAMAETLIASGVEPKYTLAVSMGFFAAATIAGCLEPKHAITALIRMARAIEKYCPKGGMLAVVAPLSLYDDPIMFSNCEMAAINSPSHFVVAADQRGLETVESYLRKYGAANQRLAVHYGFHSRWIDDARVPIEKLLPGMADETAGIPIACCARAGWLSDFSPDCFWTIARKPIRLAETITFLERQGPHFYIDAGPSGTLAAALMNGSLPRHTPSLAVPTLTPFRNEVKNLEKIMALKNTGRVM